MNFIPVNTPLLDGNERKYLLECIDTGWISSEGPFVKIFEEQFATRVGRRYGIAVANGTAALDAAIEALGIGPDDEVIMPTFTIISCINQIVRAGAKPILVDSDPVTWNMDVQQIEPKITPRTKAIMAVHIYGLPVDMAPVVHIAQKYNLKLLEDASQMLGQTYRGQVCGSFGDISIFSFYPNKHITTGEGGMIVTDNPKIADNCRKLRNLCFKPDKRFVHDCLGWNLRMTNLQAAVGLAQLERLEEFVDRKRALGNFYNRALSKFSKIVLPLKQTDYAENIYWIYGLILDDEQGVDNSTILTSLFKKGVDCRPFFWPMHEQPVLNRMGLFHGESYPVSERLARRGFYLPSGLALTTDQQEYVVAMLYEALND